MKFVLATANPGKIKEMQDILSTFGFDLVTRSDLGIEMEVEETGCTFLENALLKAQALCEATGLAAIADDSGLEVFALDGRPGVYSSSFGGNTLTDSQRCAYLISQLQGMEQKNAKFVCTIVCCFPDGTYTVAQGECFGEIIESPRGENGFGYDPVFLVDEVDKTMAELSADEKNAISHRGKALRKFVLQMQDRI